MLTPYIASAQFNGSGTGTSDDPYIILNADQFYSIRNFQSSKTYFSLITDIDLSNYAYGSGWEPIPSFQGVLDGNGHKITGLVINRINTDNVGLFGSTYRATIKNLTVEGSITGNNCVGGIVGRTLSSNYDTEYENVHFHGTINGNNYVGGIAGSDSPSVGYSSSGPGIEYNKCGFSGTITGKDYLGGIVGRAASKISNSSSIITVSGTQYVGGICGDIAGRSIEDCYTSVDISASSGFVGGISGNGTGSDIKRCSVNGKIVALGDKVGGIIGYAHCYSGVRHDFYVSDSYFMGYLKARDYVGGIIGYNGGDVWHDSANYKYWGYVRITNNYVKGTVIGNDKVGGILSGYTFTNNPIVESNVCMCSSIESETANVGRIQAFAGATPKTCYSIYNTKVSIAGVSISSEEIQSKEKNHGIDIGEYNLKTATFYQGLSWDFGSAWGIINTECIPYHQTQAAPPIIQSSLVSGETSISGNSFDGGTVEVNINNATYLAATSNYLWNITVPELHSGEKIVVHATANGLFPSYNVEKYVSYPGSGTQVDPYLIKTYTDLKNIHGNGYFKLANDIDLSSQLTSDNEISGWQPLGIYSEGIKYLDGDNHTISNLYISRDEDFVGLFANLTDATIKNLIIRTSPDKGIHGVNKVGILAGRLNNCTIQNVSVEGGVNGSTYVGGLAGEINGGTISNISVTKSSISGKNMVGGIAGTSSATTTLCRFNGNVSDFVEEDDITKNDATVYVGGLFSTSKGVIRQSSVTGTVSAVRTESRVGGLVGANYARITDCYSTCNVIGDTYAAGIAAYNQSSISNCYASGDISTLNENAQTVACGLIGYNEGADANILRSAAMNTHITASSDIGNVFRIIGGIKNSAPIPDQTNFALQNMILSINGLRMSISDDPFNGYMKRDNDFKTQALYKDNGWNFDTTWKISENNSYPLLKQLDKDPISTNKLVTEISLDKLSFVLSVGESETINATVTPDDVSNKNLMWSSTNNSVATVNNGVVTAVAQGSTHIIAVSTDGSNISVGCDVTVTQEMKDDVEASDISKMSHTVYSASFTTSAGNKYTMPINVKSTKENISGFQFDVQLPKGVTIDKNSRGTAYAVTFDAASDRTSSEYHTIVSGDQPDGSIRILCSSNSAELILGTDGAVLNIPLTIADDIESGDYPISFSNIVLSTVDAERLTSEDVMMVMTIPSFTPGDVNADTFIDVADITATASHIVGRTPANFIEAAADVNNDTYIDVADITLIAKAIIGTATLSAKRMAKSNRQASPYVNTTVDALPFQINPSTSGKQLKFHLNNPSEEISGMQFDLYLPEGITVDKNRRGTAYDYVFDTESNRTDATYHSVVSGDQADGSIRFLCSSNSAEIFMENSGPVFNIKLSASSELLPGIYTFEIKNIVVSTGDAKRLTPVDYKGTIIVGEPSLAGNVAINGRYEDVSVINSIASNKGVTSLDLLDVVSLPEHSVIETMNKNALIIINDKLSIENQTNVITNNVCNELLITDGYNFASPVPFNALSASYNRSMPNMWGTICLPFNVTVSEEDNYEFYELAGFDGETLTVNKVTESLAAGTPVLVLCSENEDGINIVQSNTNVVTETQEGSYYGALTIRGTLLETPLNYDGYIISNNKFWWINELRNLGNSVKLAPFRAWIASESVSFAKALNISIWNETSAVETIKSLTEGKTEYYDINGRRISKLQEGINLVKTKNGITKKIIVK